MRIAKQADLCLAEQPAMQTGKRSIMQPPTQQLAAMLNTFQPAMQAEVNSHKKPPTPTQTSAFKHDMEQRFSPIIPQYVGQPHTHEQMYPYHHPYMPAPIDSQPSVATQFELSPDVIAAITRALAQNSAVASSSQPPQRKYFSKAITNATSDLHI
jgi:hypothetical protein